MSQDIYITTVSGKRFFFEDMENSVLDINDIAYALSRLCRYNGHVASKANIYSVAQHSCLVAMYVRHQPIALKLPELPLAALLHDAPEYVLGDVTGPLKALFRKHGFSYFDEWDDQLSRLIEKQFGLTPCIMEHPAIKYADLAIRRNEADSLCSGADNLCPVTDAKTDGIDALDIEHIHPWAIDQVERTFMDLFLIYYELAHPIDKSV